MSLMYWGEFEIFYAPYDVTEWGADPEIAVCERKKSLGYIPVYQELEDAMANHPSSTIIEIKLIDEDIQ